MIIHVTDDHLVHVLAVLCRTVLVVLLRKRSPYQPLHYLYLCAKGSSQPNVSFVSPCHVCPFRFEFRVSYPVAGASYTLLFKPPSATAFAPYYAFLSTGPTAYGAPDYAQNAVLSNHWQVSKGWMAPLLSIHLP